MKSTLKAACLVAAIAGAVALNQGVIRLLLIGLLVATPLELLVPRRKQRLFPRGALINLAHATVTVTISGAIFVAVLGALQLLPTWPPAGRMIAALPFPLAFAAVILTGEIGYYWSHRIAHEIPALWRFHRVHHASEEMSWLAAARAHPVDQVLLQTGALLPLHLLGVSVSSYGLYGVFVIVQNLVVHGNIDLGVGPLRWLISTPEFHHWHHAADREAWNKNYAGQLPLLDLIFGSVFLPSGRRVPLNYGLVEPLTESYPVQLCAPAVDALRWSRRRFRIRSRSTPGRIRLRRPSQIERKREATHSSA